MWSAENVVKFRLSFQTFPGRVWSMLMTERDVEPIQHLVGL